MDLTTGVRSICYLHAWMISASSNLNETLDCMTLRSDHASERVWRRIEIRDKHDDTTEQKQLGKDTSKIFMFADLGERVDFWAFPCDFDSVAQTALDWQTVFVIFLHFGLTVNLFSWEFRNHPTFVLPDWASQQVDRIQVICFPNWRIVLSKAPVHSFCGISA